MNPVIGGDDDDVSILRAVGQMVGRS